MVKKEKKEPTLSEKISGFLVTCALAYFGYNWLFSNEDDAEVIISEIAQTDTLGDYASWSADHRKAALQLTLQDKGMEENDFENYRNCMGDFATSKSADLSALDVLGWCDNEKINAPDRFTSHFNELDAKDLSTDAYIICQMHIKSRLVSPASADFPFLDYSVRKMGKQRYIVQSYVDSQNAFGATLRTHFNCDMQYDLEGDALNSTSWEMLSISTS
jgi:hypothetical protein